MEIQKVLLTLLLISRVKSQSYVNNEEDDYSNHTQNNLIRDYSNITSIENILNIFNIEIVGRNWIKVNDIIDQKCAHNMMQYLDGLQEKKIWAMKMDDASSGYSSGFFWGNNYWIGSMALCRSIFKQDGDHHHYRKHSANVGLTFINGNTAHVHVKHGNPPFIPRFSVLKVILNEADITLNPRTIHIGVCLPTSCEKDDISVIADYARDENEIKSIELNDIRTPNADGFSLWKDSTFITMLTVTVIVGIFIVWGTAYDVILRKKINQRRHNKIFSKDLHSDSSGLNCTTYDLTTAISDKNKNNCVGIGIPTGMNNNNSDENLAAESNGADEDKLPLHEELLLSFSLVANFNAICDREVGTDTISCIHGIRALSMVWIILGHTCIIAFKYSDNMELRKDVEQKFFFQTITNGAFSVDTFFFISGFLVSFIYFRTNAKGNLEKLSKGVNEFASGAFHFAGLVGYRFVRLTAPYIYTMGLVTVTMKYFASNSVFEPPTVDHINCPKYWWRNVLYINTLFPVQDMCMLWSWYLANDTQFYIIGAVILIIAIKHFKFAASTLTFFLLSSWITTGVIAYRNNHIPNTDDPLALFDKIYDKPWTRIGPYLVGMSVGWILFKTNCSIKFSRAQLVTGWTLSIGTLLYLLYGLFKVELTQFTAAAYSSLSHSAWALALAWIVIACSTGHGGLLNKFLSATYLYPFSRVTYCAYLVHPIMIRAYALNNDAPIHMGIDSMMIIFMGQTCASYMLSFIVSLAFEAPVVTMLKILVPNRKNVIYKDTSS